MSVNVCSNDIFVEPFTTKLGIVMHNYEPCCLSKRLVSCLQGQGHSYDNININRIWLFNVIWTADPFATEMGLMVHHHKVDCLVKILDCSVVVKVKVTEKVKNSSECSSEWHLLSCWTFCNQTLYGDAASWARVSCKKIGLLSSSSGSYWRLI